MNKIKSSDEWNFIEFEKSLHKKYLYSAILENKNTQKKYYMHFGFHKDFYKDKTKLNLYKQFETNDIKIRDEYIKNYSETAHFNYRYSSAWFTYHYLY